MLFPLKFKVSIGDQLILLTSVATVESFSCFPLQSTETVVVLRVDNAQVQVPKSAAGGQRQTSFE